MFKHEKSLLQDVKVEKPNPTYEGVQSGHIQSQPPVFQNLDSNAKPQ